MFDNDTNPLDAQNTIIKALGRGFSVSLHSSAYYLRDSEIKHKADGSEGEVARLFAYGEFGWPPGKSKSNLRATASDTNMCAWWWPGNDGVERKGAFVVECIRYLISGGSRANRRDYVQSTAMEFRMGQTSSFPIAPLSLFWRDLGSDSTEGVLFYPAEKRLAINRPEGWSIQLSTNTEATITFEADMRVQVQLLGDSAIVNDGAWLPGSDGNQKGHSTFVDTTKLVAATAKDAENV